MKRFEFSLERLLSVKRKLEQIADLKLLNAYQNLADAKGDLNTLTDKLCEVSEQMSLGLGQAVSASHWVAASSFSERIGQAIAVMENKVAKATEDLTAAENERNTIVTEVESLVVLRRDRFDEWQHEEMKEEQERLDEISIRSWEVNRAQSVGAT